MRPALAFAIVLAASACAPSRPEAEATVAPRLVEQDSGTDALLIGAHAVSDRVVWLSGTGGTVVRTTDGGATWTASTVPGADSLQLRDVHAVDAETAWALSIGPGDDSRIYKTTDGGATWRQVFTNPEADGFFDCLSFWDARRGLAFSDSVDGTFLIVTTDDGGETWTRVPASALPPAAEGEGGFASSGTCVATHGTSTAWIGTGNASAARVLRTDDGGRTWAASTTPLAAGEAAGVASVAFRDAQHGVALGGDIGAPDVASEAAAFTADGGRTWTAGGRLPFTGAAYGAAYVPGTSALLAVGPGGAALSRDDGRTWALLDERTFWGVAAAGSGSAWLVGPEGRVVRVVVE